MAPLCGSAYDREKDSVQVLADKKGDPTCDRNSGDIDAAGFLSMPTTRAAPFNANAQVDTPLPDPMSRTDLPRSWGQPEKASPR